MYMQYVHSQQLHTEKEQTPAFFVSPQRHTHTCSGHRSKAKASANQILTITCLAKLILQAGQQLRHLQYLHISCHASDHHSYCTFSVKGTVTPKARKTKYSNAPRGSWNHSILNTASADERQVISVVTTPTQWTYVRQCWTTLKVFSYCFMHCSSLHLELVNGFIKTLHELLTASTVNFWGCPQGLYLSIIKLEVIILEYFHCMLFKTSSPLRFGGKCTFYSTTTLFTW